VVEDWRENDDPDATELREKVAAARVRGPSK
jgi:hypothetical protein